MFVPMPVPTVFNAGNEMSDATQINGTADGSAAAMGTQPPQQQPTFFVPQDAYVPTPAAELEGVQPISDVPAEEAVGLGDVQRTGSTSSDRAPTAYLHPERDIDAGEAVGGLTETVSSAASAVGPPPYFSHATEGMEARVDAFGAESIDGATGSVSYNNDLTRDERGTMHSYSAHDYTRGDATLATDGSAGGTLYEQQHSSNGPSSDMGVGLQPPPVANVDSGGVPTTTDPVQPVQDDAVYGVPSVKTNISEDNIDAHARLENTHVGGIPFTDSPYHNRSKSGSDFFRSINNVTPDNDPDNSGQNSAQSPLRSSGTAANGGGSDGWAGADLAAPPNGESHTAVDPNDTYRVAETDLNATVSRNSFDDTYYYTNTMGSSNGLVPPPPSTFVIGAHEDGTVMASTDTVAQAAYDGGENAHLAPTFMVPSGGVGVMQPTTAMAHASFDASAGSMDTSWAPSDRRLSGEDTPSEIGALALAAATATSSTHETVLPSQIHADAGFEGGEDNPESPPPPPPPPPFGGHGVVDSPPLSPLPVNGYAPPPPPPLPPVAFPSADTAAATVTSSDDEGVHLKSGQQQVGTSPVDGIVVDESVQQDGAPGGSGLTLAPPMTPSFNARIPPMTPTSPVPTTANGSFLSPTPFRTLQTLAAAVESEEDLRSILEMETRIHQYQHELQQQQQRIEAQDSELEAARRQYQDYYYQQYQRDIVAQQSQFEALIAAERRLREEAMEQVQLLLQQQQQMQERQSAANEAGIAPNDVASTSAAAHPPGDDAGDGMRKDADDDDAMSDLLCCLGQESRKVLVLSNELHRLGVDVDPLLDGIDEDFSLAAGDDDDEEEQDDGSAHIGEEKYTGKER